MVYNLQHSLINIQNDLQRECTSQIGKKPSGLRKVPFKHSDDIFVGGVCGGGGLGGRGSVGGLIVHVF